MFRLASTLFRIKSNCRARFSAFIGSQLWERIIQCVISCGAQPFPKQNIISLNVSLMLIGLINKSLAIYGVLGKARPEHGGVISGVKISVIEQVNNMDKNHAKFTAYQIYKRSTARKFIKNKHKPQGLHGSTGFFGGDTSQV